MTSAQLQAPTGGGPGLRSSQWEGMHGWTDIAGMLDQPVLCVTSHPKLAETGVCCKNHTLLKLGGEAEDQGRASTAKSHPLPRCLAVWEGQ